MDVLPVSQARSGLSETLRQFRARPDAEPVALGSHRKPEAVLMPYAQFEKLRRDAIDLDRLRGLSPLIRRLAAAARLGSVRVFGSVARGEHTPSSDVDLLVSPGPETTLFDIAQFELDLELLLGRSVTVVPDTALDPARDGNILDSALEL